MNRLDQLRQQIDACRPGSDDLHLPELAELKAAVASSGEVAAELDRAQRFDQSVTSALYDVPVPSGLLDRLLVSAASPVALAGIEQAIDVGPSAAPSDAPQAAGAAASGSRRTWLWRVGSIALAAAAALAIGVFVSNRSPREVTAEQLAADIPAWFTAADSQDGWSTARVPPGFPWDKAVRGNPRAWRSLKTPTGEPAVVYEVASGNGTRALLFVVATRARYQVPTLPGSPLRGTTGGLQASAWQGAANLYVLVVKAPGATIDSFLIKRQLG
jgi:hypothetical protein